MTSSEPTPTIISSIERNLSTKLHIAIVKTSEKFIQSVKFSQMKKNFRMIYNQNPDFLKNIHDQLCLQMKRSILDDLHGLCTEHCIDYLLETLESLKKSQESSKHSWRPSGNPEEDLRDHIYPLKLKQKEDLQAILTKLQLSNEGLFNEASVNHAEILHAKECNDDLYKAFNNITSSFTGSNLKNLQETMSNIVKAA